MPLVIHNLRYGFATNSSSSHSILLLPDAGAKDTIAPVPSYDGYGWDNFTLTSEPDKINYLASQVGQRLGYDSWPQTTDDHRKNTAIIEQIADLIGTDEFGSPTYVDHQSTWVLPGSWEDESELNQEFIRALADFMRNERTVVLGGNDNGDGHPLVSVALAPNGRGEGGPYRSFLWRYPLRDWSGLRIVARNDGTHWVFFNRGDGTRTRLSFDSPETPKRGEAPELADVKITNYCTFGCSMCYMDSTPQGKHATMKQIGNVIDTLSELRVFEVAIGGGEPTLHPDFTEILRLFREAKIVPNFTTRNLGWLRDARRAQEIMSHAGAFAFSAHNLNDVIDLGEAVKNAGISAKEDWGVRSPVVVHIVMGTVEPGELKAMLMAADDLRFDVTLLGWKRIGRAALEPTIPYLDWWLDAVKQSGTWRIGIDTTLAAECHARGQLDDFPRWMYHLSDGDFSCYVDAVAQTCAPSSWEPERGKWPLGDLSVAFASRWDDL